MKYMSYWHDSATPFGDAQTGPVTGHVDVAVIGGGFTGLNAARKLAREGVSVALLELSKPKQPLPLRSEGDLVGNH